MHDDRVDDVRNEIRSRRTNEWIRSAHESFGHAGEEKYVCECSESDPRWHG